MTLQRALVLGGGGVAGIAWETGVLAGLADAGVDAAAADYVLGTSAGSAVAAQLGSGLSWAELFRRQADPAAQNEELGLGEGVSVTELRDTWLRLAEETPDADELRRRKCALALEVETVPESARRAVIAGRLPDHAWPERGLGIVVVDAHTGEPRVFDRNSGVALVDAVAASCAVPGVWPPVTIGGSRFVDGGIRSGSNADLVAGHDRVLVIVPWPDPSLPEEVAVLREHGQVEVITADEASLAAIGDDPLDPATRTPAAKAGYAQGRQAAAAAAGGWNAHVVAAGDAGGHLGGPR